MMFRYRRKCASLACGFLLLVAAKSSALGQEAVHFDEPCRRADAGKPLRQTIVILDEAMVAGTKLGDNSGDQRWTKTIEDLSGVFDTESHRNVAPGERLSILLARQNGQDLVTVFTGCSPNLSANELTKLRANESSIARFFGGGVDSSLKGQKRNFESALGDAFAEVFKASKERRGVSVRNDVRSLIRAIQSGGRFIDLSMGIPRIVIISPLQSSDLKRFSNVKSAREAGFQLGQEAGLNFERAELYVSGVITNDADPFLRNYYEAFFLRSKALLVGWRTDGIPALSGEPVDVKVFGGAVEDGPGHFVPVQVRVASDAQGNLINSWIEVTRDRANATPFAGKSICRARDDCDIRGDGTLLGRAWNPDPEGGANGALPLYGLRYIELHLKGRSAHTRVYDPTVIIQPDPALPEKTVPDIRFDLVATDGQQF